MILLPPLGKDAEQASGLSTIEQTVDAPITDSRLVVMERMNVLLSRFVAFHIFFCVLFCFVFVFLITSSQANYALLVKLKKYMLKVTVILTFTSIFCDQN